jgi:hypothetical protein
MWTEPANRKDNQMKRKHWQLSDLVVCRSDAGDGGWSLHAPWATDGQIANGDQPPLRSGPATWDEQKRVWDRPNERDRQEAMNVLSAQDKVSANG